MKTKDITFLSHRFLRFVPRLNPYFSGLHASKASIIGPFFRSEPDCIAPPEIMETMPCSRKLSGKTHRPIIMPSTRSGMIPALFFAFIFCNAAFSQTIAGRYILILQDPPVSAKFGPRAELESSAAVSYRRQIEAKQTTLKQELASRNIGVTGSASVLSNVVFVAAPASRVDEMRALPGVADVRPMRKFRKKLDRATTVLNGPAAWAALGGISNAGLGMKIGILDSGIDQNHAAFQDSTVSPPAGFPKCTTGHPEDCAYTNNKVIVARSYVRTLSAGSNPANPALDSEPDDYSPRDRDGHGTGVAASAAAVPTVTPGISSTGGAITIQGMAPKAFLGNYKLAGSPGVAENASDQTLIQAVEDAYTDGMDVITTSWGSNALTNVAGDPVAMAWEAAAKGGAIVLAAAGNSGESAANYPSFNTISSPSNAPDVISVGATENSHVMLPSVTLNGANAPSALIGIPAQPSDSYPYPSSQGGNTGPLVDVTAIDPTGLACNALPANSLNGSYVLIERGSCSFDVKATNAENAGAIGVILYWADSTTVNAISGVGFNNTGDAEFIGPIVAISNASGLSLKSFIDANPGRTVTIQPGGIEQDIATWSQINSSTLDVAVTTGQLAGFSSFGPTPDGQLKPDMVAVGGNDIGFLSTIANTNDFFIPTPSGIFMPTQSYDPNQSLEGGSDFGANGYWAADGTSFATPMTAGAAAMAKQAHPGLRGTQIRSLLINSAAQTITTDDSGIPVDAEWIGNGLLNAGAAVAATVTVEPATVSFGVINNATFPISQALTVTNIGSASVTLAATVSCCTVNANAGSLTNATVAVSPASITLAAGASTTVTVTLSGKTPPASEYSGAILLTSSASTTRVPFMLIEGDGVATNVNVIQMGGEGAPGQDIGPAIVQITDDYGAAVAGYPITFTISPRGSFVLQSVSGEPTCTTSATSATCNTDQFGFAYAEIINGATARQATIGTTVLGNPFSGTVNIQAAPNVTGVADAAAGATTVAPGSYIAIYGSGLSNYTDGNSNVYNPNSTPTTEATDPVIANGVVLPLQVDYVTVSFDVPSAGISVPGHITYVSPGQVNVQVPWELQGQSSAQMKVTLNGDLIGNVVTVNLANAAPAFFTYNNIAIGTDTVNFNLLTASNPAKRGSVIVLYANGLGPVNNQPASGDPAGATTLSTLVTLPTVTIGGQPANVAYAGLVPSLPGLYQLNVTVPAGISAGTQNIVVTAGGQTSTSTLPIQ